MEKNEHYWIVSIEQLACLASSRRQAVLDLIAKFGPVSASDISRLSGLQRTTIYQHIAKLTGVGLVYKSGERGQGTKSEALYETPSRRMRLAKALEDENNAALTIAIAAAMLRQTQCDISSGIVSDRKEVSGPATNLFFHRFIGAPSPEKLVEIGRLIEELRGLISAEELAEGPPVAFTIVMAPVDKV